VVNSNERPIQIGLTGGRIRRVTSRVNYSVSFGMPPTKSLKKQESVDLFLVLDDGIDWSQVSETQFDTQLDTQLQTQPETQSETQVETQTTLIGEPSFVKPAHSSASPPVRTISVESGSSTQTNDSAKTLVDDEDVDYRALLEGAENIDWDDWGTDEEDNTITTPRKPKTPSKSKKFTPVKPKNLRGMVVAGGGGELAITPPPYTKPCTRCIVVNVTRYDYLDHPVQVSGFSYSCPPPFFLPRDAWFETPIL
jgi:hypothetical protein